MTNMSHKGQAIKCPSECLMSNIDLNLLFPAVEPLNIAVSKAKDLRQYSQSTKLFPKQVSVFTEDASAH